MKHDTHENECKKLTTNYEQLGNQQFFLIVISDCNMSKNIIVVIECNLLWHLLLTSKQLLQQIIWILITVVALIEFRNNVETTTETLVNSNTMKYELIYLYSDYVIQNILSLHIIFNDIIIQLVFSIFTCNYRI